MPTTIPTINPYTGQVAVPGQPQATFTFNMQSQLTYEANLAPELNATVAAMNTVAGEVETLRNEAQTSATNAATSATNALNAELAIKDFIDGQDIPGEPPVTGGPYVYINGGWVEFPIV